MEPAAAAAAPEINHVGHLNEVLHALGWSWQQTVTWTSEQATAPDLRWRVKLTIQLDKNSLPTSYMSNLCSTIQAGKNEAARKALEEHPELRSCHQRLFTRGPSSPANAQPLRPSSALQQFCTSIRAKVVYTSLAGGAQELFGCACTIEIDGDPKKYVFEEGKAHPTKQHAKEAVAVQALHNMSRGYPEAQRMIESIAELRISPKPGHVQRTVPPPIATSFVYGRPCSLEEGREIEFKGALEVSGPWVFNTGSKPTVKKKKISGALAMFREVAGEYISAYLNTGIHGLLYLGVHDSGIVQGIPLTARDRDEVKQAYDAILGQFYPPIAIQPQLVKLHLVPVTGYSTELFLIVIEVSPPPGALVVYFYNSIAWIKREASKSIMKPAELIERIKKATQLGLM